MSGDVAVIDDSGSALAGGRSAEGSYQAGAEQTCQGEGEPPQGEDDAVDPRSEDGRDGEEEAFASLKAALH